MALNILFTILGFFVLVYFESLFLAFLGIRLFIIIFFFLFREISWEVLFVASVLLLLVFDVIYKVPLGSNILMFVLPFGLFVLLSMFISLRAGIVSFIIKILIFSLYYILLLLLPNLFVSGELGFVSLVDLRSSFLRAVLSVLILLLLEYVYARFRKRGNSSQIRLK
jgi:hypothetical protein